VDVGGWLVRDLDVEARALEVLASAAASSTLRVP
jgi:hypothetical protein